LGSDSLDADTKYGGLFDSLKPSDFDEPETVEEDEEERSIER
jgi:hypothetical protein